MPTKGDAASARLHMIRRYSLRLLLATGLAAACASCTNGPTVILEQSVDAADASVNDRELLVFVGRRLAVK